MSGTNCQCSKCKKFYVDRNPLICPDCESGRAEHTVSTKLPSFEKVAECCILSNKVDILETSDSRNCCLTCFVQNKYRGT